MDEVLQMGLLTNLKSKSNLAEQELINFRTALELALDYFSAQDVAALLDDPSIDFLYNFRDKLDQASKCIDDFLHKS